MNCKHMNFESRVSIGRLHEEGNPEKITAYIADITICCVECGCKFAFKGVPGGMSFNQPMVNFDGTELRAPLEPTMVKLDGAKQMKMN